MKVGAALLVAGMTRCNRERLGVPCVLCWEQMLYRDPPRRQGARDVAVIWKFHKLAAIKAHPFLFQIQSHISLRARTRRVLRLRPATLP